MTSAALEQTVRWLRAQARAETLEVTFHGGEPLTAPAAFYRQALPALRDAWDGRPVRFTLQSNLWRLNDELAQLFAEYGVSLGTSLDGPREINDAQRGAGYFDRTMRGIQMARRYGLDVGCIATFTVQSAQHWRKTTDFFLSEGLSFSIHAALPILGQPAQQPWVLSPDAYARLSIELLDYYLARLKSMRIASMDAVIRSVSAGKGGICTFGDCLGGYLCAAPDGSVYPCQRFAGNAAFRLGSVSEDVRRLADAPVWRQFLLRQQRVTEACGDCAYQDICRGGCPYNVLAANRGLFPENDMRDPYCPAYRSLFDAIVDRGAAEVFAPDNLEQVIEDGADQRGMLRKGRILELMSNKTHPYETAQNARLALSATALAQSQGVEAAAAGLARIGLINDPTRALPALQRLEKRLSGHRQVLNNVYLHITLDCPQHCLHCYAEAGDRSQQAFPKDAVVQIAREVNQSGFRHLVITGGEPLVHAEITGILTALAEIRPSLRPLRLVLRTSLAGNPSDALLDLVANATDEVVVSLDGDEQTHDARRGQGSHARTVEAVRRLTALRGRAEVSLAAVLPLPAARGEPGRQVRQVAHAQGVRRVRFRPVLPLGRAMDSMPDLLPEAAWSSLSAAERMAYGFLPASSCGMGQNLYIEPDGAAYPCYAWHAPAWRLGNVLAPDGLAEVLNSSAWESLGCATVDSNRGCRTCALRYLCGGMCRAWTFRGEAAQTDLDAPAGDCTRLRERAAGLLTSALAYLEIPEQRWLDAGFQLQ